MRLRSKLNYLTTRHKWMLPSAFLLVVAALVSIVVPAIGKRDEKIQMASEKTPIAIFNSTATPPVGATTSGTTVATPGEVPPLPTEDAGIRLPLTGRRIGLDPGHGPRDDLGAVLVDHNIGEIALAEAELNLDLALRVRAILVARGASVVLTRESADTFTAPWPVDANGDGEVGSVSDDLQQRVDILNNSAVEVFLSIHTNGGMSDPPAENYLQVLYCGSSDCISPEKNEQLGNIVLGQLQAKLAGVIGSVEGQVLTDTSIDSSNPPEHLFVLGHINPPGHVRATAMPGVLAEALYVTSPEQAAQLKQDAVRQAIALAYADSLQAYLLEDK